MYLIWKTTEAEGEYWAFIDVEGICNFRPVPVDDWPSILRPLQEHFNIELWVLYEKTSSPTDHKGGFRGNHQWTALERPENKDVHKYLLYIGNEAKE